MKIRTLPIIISIIALFVPVVVSAQQPEGPHVLLGSQPSALYYEAFCKQVADQTISAGQHEAVILLIPMGDVVKEGSLAASDRTSLLKNAETQKSSLEAACNKVSAADISYQIVILPVFTREDAAETSLATYSNPTPAGILVLDGDLSRGIDIIDNTPFENVLHTLFQNPQVVIGGVGNGADYLARSRITGSNPAYAMEHPLQFDSIQVQQGDASLSTFGDQVLIDHDIFSGMGIPEMINALTPSNQPHIGIGLDGPVGVPIDADNKIEGIIGDGRVIILDTETYHAAETTEYQGINNSLSVRNILVQSLDPGDFTYDFGSRQHSLAKPQSSLLRGFNFLYTPARSGEIYLMGSTSSELKDTETYMDFINSSGGKSAKLLAIAAGYPDNETAEKEINNISKVFGIPMDSVVDPGDPRLQTANLAEYSGIILSVPENNQIDGWLDKLIPMKNAWSRGIPILALGQASAILGSYYPGAENGSVMEPGLGLLNAIYITRIRLTAMAGSSYSKQQPATQKLSRS